GRGGAVHDEPGAALHDAKRCARQLARAGLGYDAADFILRHADVSLGVRTCGVHRHVAVDRSRARPVLRALDEPRLRRRDGGRDARSAARLSRRVGKLVTLTAIDWVVIAGYFLLNLAIGLYYARRARGSTTEFFLSGRDVPWWLAGTSMV